MAVKHRPTAIVHKGQNGNETGCGQDTKEHASLWINTSEKVNCKKKGCKNA